MSHIGTQRAVSEWGNTFCKWLWTRPHSIPADEFFIGVCLLDFASASTVKDSWGYLLIVRYPIALCNYGTTVVSISSTEVRPYRCQSNSAIMGVAVNSLQQTDTNNHVVPCELWGNGTTDHASCGNERISNTELYDLVPLRQRHYNFGHFLILSKRIPQQVLNV